MWLEWVIRKDGFNTANGRPAQRLVRSHLLNNRLCLSVTRHDSRDDTALALSRGVVLVQDSSLLARVTCGNDAGAADFSLVQLLNLVWGHLLGLGLVIVDQGNAGVLI